MKVLLLITLCAGIVSFVHAQKQVTGTVTDARDSSQLAGVSIKIKGSTRGTTTDVNGEFSLSVPANAVLELSFIGYANKEVPIIKKSNDAGTYKYTHIHTDFDACFDEVAV